MRILFDQGTPVPLRRSLTGHVIATAYELGWSTVTNGELIRLAEQEDYELLITTDTNLRYQQNLSGRSIAILVLTTTSWPRIRQVTGELQAAVAAIESGGYEELFIPRTPHRCSSQRSSDRPMIRPMPVFHSREGRWERRCSQRGIRSPQCSRASTASTSRTTGSPMASTSSRSIPSFPSIGTVPSWIQSDSRLAALT